MRLYFLRHGIAEDTAASDAERKLTNKGIAQLHDGARLFKQLDIKLKHLYSSPLVRAKETAEIVGKALDVEVQIRKEVSPGFSVEAVAALTHDLDSADEVMFVGHEPDFSTVVGALIGGQVVMKKGGLARVDVLSSDPLSGELVWLIAPKIYEQFKS